MSKNKQSKPYKFRSDRMVIWVNTIATQLHWKTNKQYYQNDSFIHSVCVKKGRDRKRYMWRVWWWLWRARAELEHAEEGPIRREYEGRKGVRNRGNKFGILQSLLNFCLLLLLSTLEQLLLHHQPPSSMVFLDCVSCSVCKIQRPS